MISGNSLIKINSKMSDGTRIFIETNADHSFGTTFFGLIFWLLFETKIFETDTDTLKNIGIVSLLTQLSQHLFAQKG